MTTMYKASEVVLAVRNPVANARNVRDAGSIARSGRSPGGGHGNLFKCSCRENFMDRGAFQAVHHRVAE